MTVPIPHPGTTRVDSAGEQRLDKRLGDLHDERPPVRHEVLVDPRTTTRMRSTAGRPRRCGRIANATRKVAAP